MGNPGRRTRKWTNVQLYRRRSATNAPAASRPVGLHGARGRSPDQRLLLLKSAQPLIWCRRRPPAPEALPALGVAGPQLALGRGRRRWKPPSGDASGRRKTLAANSAMLRTGRVIL